MMYFKYAKNVQSSTMFEVEFCHISNTLTHTNHCIPIRDSNQFTMLQYQINHSVHQLICFVGKNWPFVSPMDMSGRTLILHPPVFCSVVNNRFI